jgi:hypothetical protein
MDIVTIYDDRKHARLDERLLELEDPGPYNRVPWAGKGKEALPKLGLAIVTVDPMEAGIQFGNAIDPTVQDAIRKRERNVMRWADPD